MPKTISLEDPLGIQGLGGGYFCSLWGEGVLFGYDHYVFLLPQPK